MNQIPMLELVIESNTAQSDYKALNNHYGHLLWVYTRNYGENNPDLAPVYNRVAQWHLDAYEKTPHPESVGHLIVAANLFSKSVEVLETTYGPYHPDLIAPLYGIVHANFKLVEPYGFIPNIDSFISGKISPLIPSEFDRRREDDFDRYSYNALNYNQEHLSRIVEDQKNGSSLVQNSYKSGRNALERIVDIFNHNPELPVISHANAMTHLGDWYLRFYKRTAALANYQKAYQLLLTNGYDGDNVKGLFGHPQSLDKLATPLALHEEPLPPLLPVANDTGDAIEDTPLPLVDVNPDEKFVVVEFNVTQYGAVRDLEIIESNPPDNVRFRRMARERIASTPFRPRLEDGKPIETENVKMVYRFN
jgi:hypothetical protein